MNYYLPGMEPDFDIRQELRFIGGVLDLRQFDKIFISVSGGKDSQAMLFLMRDLAEKQGAKDRLIAMYADTGMEWHNAESHVRTICAAADIPLQVVYPIRPMLEKFAHRIELAKKGLINQNAFPSSTCRYCTSEQKVAPMDNFTRRFSGTLLKVTGERWQESKARSTYPEFVKLKKLWTENVANQNAQHRYRHVYGWRPMLGFQTKDIFSMIENSGVPRHVCYDMGCERLGCAGCIFSGDRQTKIEMRENPKIFEAIDKLETDSGHYLSMFGRPIRERIKK